MNDHAALIVRKPSLNRTFSNLFTGVVVAFSTLMVIPLVLILSFITLKGITFINWDLFLHDERTGGVLNAMVGSAYMVLVAVVLAVPVAVLAGIYLAEVRRGRLASAMRITVDVFQGVPSIILGIVAYVWFVVPFHSFSAFSGAVALAIMMLPIIIKNTEESLLLVPHHLKEGALALGAPYHKVILDIVLPAAASGILTGILLATARILGETAPLLFTGFGNRDLSFDLSKPMESLPPLIFKYAQSPTDSLVNTAWAASFVLVVFVLLLNVSTKMALSQKQ